MEFHAPLNVNVSFWQIVFFISFSFMTRLVTLLSFASFMDNFNIIKGFNGQFDFFFHILQWPNR